MRLEQLLKSIGVFIGTIISFLSLIKLIAELRKLFVAWRAKRIEHHPGFKRIVLKELKQIAEVIKVDKQRYETYFATHEDYFAALTREQLKIAYDYYYRRLGYCPPDVKAALLSLYDIYLESNDHEETINGGQSYLIVNYRDKINGLPESEKEKEERNKKNYV